MAAPKTPSFEAVMRPELYPERLTGRWPFLKRHELFQNTGASTYVKLSIVFYMRTSNQNPSGLVFFVKVVTIFCMLLQGYSTRR